MDSFKLSEFRERIDNDAGLKSKRKILVGLSIVMIGFNIAGATLHEANTIIFKLEIKHHENLLYLFSISILYMTLRYYGYAKIYHDQLFHLWTKRMLGDYRVFSYTPKLEEIDGLLGKIIDVWPGDNPGIQTPNYKVAGVFKRNLTYECAGQDEIHGEYAYYENIELNRYSNNWKFRDFLNLLSFEFKYQLEALLKYRESLDLLFPYILSAIALLSLAFRASPTVGT